MKRIDSQHPLQHEDIDPCADLSLRHLTHQSISRELIKAKLLYPLIFAAAKRFDDQGHADMISQFFLDAQHTRKDHLRMHGHILHLMSAIAIAAVSA